MTNRTFTVASLAAAWECSEGVIRKLIAAKLLGSFRIGSLIRIPADEVERFECQNTRCSGSGEDMRSSISKTANGDESDYTRPTGLELKRKLGKVGEGGTILPGPWGES